MSIRRIVPSLPLHPPALADLWTKGPKTVSRDGFCLNFTNLRGVTFAKTDGKNMCASFPEIFLKEGLEEWDRKITEIEQIWNCASF